MTYFSFLNGVTDVSYTSLAFGGRTILNGDANSFSYNGDKPGEVITVFGAGFAYQGGHAVAGSATFITGLNSVTGAQTFQSRGDFGNVASYNTLSTADQIAKLFKGGDYITANIYPATNDVISAGLGNDTIVPGLGSDIVDAGLGDDTIVFNFASTAARVSSDGLGRAVVDGPSNSHYTISNAEHYQFTDGLLNDLGQVQHLNPAYRFFDTKTGDHFYTTSPVEKQQIEQTIPYFKYEGAAWSTPDKAANTVDVFRFFDTATGDHVLTTSLVERDQILRINKNYQYEGVAFQAYTDSSSAGAGALTLERFFNTETGKHHFAANAAEAYGINHGAAGANWVDEGPGFVVHVPTNDLLNA